MHRVVIFSEPVCINGELLYGKLHEGDDDADILDYARKDLKRLTIVEQWTGQQGDEFREKENWVLEDADWRAVCAVKTGIVAAVIQETVRIRTGVRTENVRLKRISGTVTSVISSAEKACWGKSNLMVLHCLSEDMGKKIFYLFKI